MSLPSVLLVGGGRMGSAMLRGWQERGLAPSVVIDPSPAVRVGPGATLVPEAGEVPAEFRPAAVVLAVKPQLAEAALTAVAPLVGDAVVLSIMAGRTITALRGMLGEVRLVRAMPNTPASIGRGISVACAGPGVDAAARTLCDALLGSVGAVAWVEEEAMLDAVTAVSGSGPAYVFLLAELLEAAAREQGLPGPLARQLARATVAGAGALLDASAEEAGDLRRAVTSPGGTTQAALAVLMAPAAWPAAVSEAVRAAAQRSRELAG